MRFPALIVVGVLIAVGAQASPRTDSPSSVMQSYQGGIRHFLLDRSAQSSVFRAETTDAGEQTSGESVVTPSASTPQKSAQKAFFLSLLLPGLGEYYAGNHLRAGIFLAAEATAWSLWGVYRGKGKDWEKKYIDWQAEHWDFDRYNAYRRGVWSYVDRTTNMFDPNVASLSARQEDSLTVLIGTHHYDACCGESRPSDDDRYEMIGKYYRFSYGWDDVTVYDDSSKFLRSLFPVPPVAADSMRWGRDPLDWGTVRGGELVVPALDTNFVYQAQYLDRVHSDNRSTYMRMREKSNNHFGTARTMITVVMFNHVISAIHAARLVSAMNKTGAPPEPSSTHIRATMQQTEYRTTRGLVRDMIPMLMVTQRF
jgi:hypothetical protein